MIEFLVLTKPRRESDGWIIEGRCWTDVRVGDIFDEEIPISWHHYPDGEVVAMFGPVRPVVFVIKRIQAYRKEFQEWSSGMTAVITLEGDMTLHENALLRSD
jgi:hypothetical protein